MVCSFEDYIFPFPNMRECRFGRDNFEESLRMVAATDNNAADWSKFKYMVFDIPNHHGTYKERYDSLGWHLIPKSCFHHIHLATKLDT